MSTPIQGITSNLNDSSLRELEYLQETLVELGAQLGMDEEEQEEFRLASQGLTRLIQGRAR